MNDTTAWSKHTSATGDLASIYEHIVVRTAYSRKPHRAKRFTELIPKLLKHLLRVLGGRDIRQHEITLIGIHAAATALAAIALNFMLSAIGDIHLVFHHLMATENHGRARLPKKETTIRIGDCMLREMLLSREVKDQSAAFWKNNG